MCSLELGSVLPRIVAFVRLFALGCNSSTVKISGKVTLNQEPVAGTIIDFTSSDGSKNFRGVSLDDGTYRIDYGADGGLPMGRYQITVSRAETLDGQPLPSGEAGMVLRNSGQAIDRRYVLHKEIATSSTEFDLVLDDAEPPSSSGGM